MLEFRHNFETMRRIPAPEAIVTGQLFANMVDTFLFTHIQHLRHSESGITQLRLRLPSDSEVRNFASICNRGGTGQSVARTDNIKFYSLGSSIDEGRLICDYAHSSRAGCVCRYDYDSETQSGEMSVSLLRIALGYNGQPIGWREFEQLHELLSAARVA